MLNISKHRNSERRAFPRWPVAIEGRCYGRIGSSKCLITEMSENGIAIVTGQSLRIGEVLTAAWCLDGDPTPLQIHGVVRDTTTVTVGLEFLDITLADRLRIGRFINNRGSHPQAIQRSV